MKISSPLEAKQVEFAPSETHFVGKFHPGREVILVREGNPEGIPVTVVSGPSWNGRITVRTLTGGLLVVPGTMRCVLLDEKE